MVNTGFGGIYRGKTVVITGNTGFKGSWLALWLQELGANVHGFSLDDHGDGSHFRLLGLDYPTTFGDIRNREALRSFLVQTHPHIVFHLAAQSLVRESYKQPHTTYEINVIGTLSLLEAGLHVPGLQGIVNITTDKVYENDGSRRAFRESDSLGGYDPYSASKACSEILTASFRRSFLSGEKPSYLLASARAGNVIGGGDWAADRLVPDVMRATFNRAETSIRFPDAVRPWQHVLEPLSGYLLLGSCLLERRAFAATSWNFGPTAGNGAAVRDVLERMQAQWKQVQWRSEKKNSDPHEANVLLLDSTHAHNALGWNPLWDFGTSIDRTVAWYREFYERGTVRSREDLLAYVAAAATQTQDRNA